MHWLAFALLALAPLRASADGEADAAAPATKRVALLAFHGPDGPEAREQFMASLRTTEGIELVPAYEVRASSVRLSLDIERPEDLPAIAADLDIDAFIEAEVSQPPRTRSFAVNVIVRNGADGSIIGTEGWTSRSFNGLNLQSTGFARIAHIVMRSQRPVRVAVQRTPPVVQAPRPAAVSGVDDEEVPPPQDESEHASSGGRYSIFSVGFLGGTLRRTMNATVAPQRLGGQTESRSYESAGIGAGELGGELEFYPGAIGSQPFPYLGIVGAYRHSIGLASRGCAPAVQGDSCPSVIKIGTRQQDIYGGLRARGIVYGTPGHGLELSADVGFNFFEFALSVDDLATVDYSSVIAPFGYSSLLFGGGIAYDFVEHYLNIGVHGGYRHGVRLGNNARAAWGADTKTFSSFEVGMRIRSEMPYIVRGLYLGLDVAYFGFKTKFSGNTICYSSACGAPPALYEPLSVPEPVTDNYLRLGLTLGYVLR